MKFLEAALILLVILIFVVTAPVLLWILKLLLAIGLISLAVSAWKEDKIFNAVIFLILGLAFQPIVPLGFGEIVWTVLKIALILWLLSLIFAKN